METLSSFGQPVANAMLVKLWTVLLVIVACVYASWRTLALLSFHCDLTFAPMLIPCFTH